jgi:hypothetical protein
VVIPQLFVSVLGPGQVLPPTSGGGFVQVRVRDWLPPPQVLEHDFQELHDDQEACPSMVEKAEKAFNYIPVKWTLIKFSIKVSLLSMRISTISFLSGTLPNLL